MSNEEENKDEKAAGVPKKKPVVLFIIIGVVLLGAIGAGVVFAGPALGIGGDESASDAKGAKKKKKPKKSAEAESADGEEGGDIPEEDPSTAKIKSKISRLNALVVDVQDTDGSRHHLKVNIAVEHPEGKEEEFVTVEPRARESLILYLRTLNFAQVTDPNGFGKIRDEVIRRMRKAFGEEFPARRILITDFVAQ